MSATSKSVDNPLQHVDIAGSRAFGESRSDSGSEDELDTGSGLDTEDEVAKDRQSYLEEGGSVTIAQVVAVIYEQRLKEARAQRDRAQEQNIEDLDRLAVLRPISRDTLSTPESVYSTHAVEASPRLIRLLRLCEPRSPELTSDLEFTLMVVSLDNTTVYDAISYAWGDPSSEEAIYVNGALFYIRKNLYEALVALREDQEKSIWIWVDAICINQSNSVERGHQVTLMRDIFAGARTVHIWLGTAVPGSQQLFDLIKSHAVKKYATWLCTGREKDECEESRGTNKQIGETSKITIAEGTRSALEELSKCQWWRRLWTVQEVANAVDPIVHWGQHTISFVILHTAIADLFCEKYLMIDWSSICSMSGITEQLEDVQQLSQFYGAMSRAALSTYAPSANELLEGASLRHATLDHDRLYALLGLLNRDVKILPDYNARMEDVYEQATISLLRNENTPDLLGLAGLHGNRRPGLPSWAFDFGYGDYSALIDLGEALEESATLQLEEFNLTTPQKGILSLRGRKIDQIRLCSEVGPYLRHNSFHYMDTLDMQSLKRILQKWHKFARGSTNWKVEFWYAIFGPRWQVGYFHTYDAITKWLFEGADDDILDDVASRAMSTGCNRVSANSAFVTQAGYFGIGVEPARVGDVIISFTGSIRHFIVRGLPLQTDFQNQRVGECSYNSSGYRTLTPQGDERIDLV